MRFEESAGRAPAADRDAADPATRWSLSTSRRQPRAAAEEWMRADLSRPVGPLSGRLVRQVLIKRLGRDPAALPALPPHPDGRPGQTATPARRRGVHGVRGGRRAAGDPDVPLRDLVAGDSAYPARPPRARPGVLARRLRRPARRVSLRTRTPPTRSTACCGAPATSPRRTASCCGRPRGGSVPSVRAAGRGRGGVPVPDHRDRRRRCCGCRCPAGVRRGDRTRRRCSPTSCRCACGRPATARSPELAAHVSAELGLALRHQRLRGEELQRELLAGGRRAAAGRDRGQRRHLRRRRVLRRVPSSARHLSSGPVDDLASTSSPIPGHPARLNVTPTRPARRRPRPQRTAPAARAAARRARRARTAGGPPAAGRRRRAGPGARRRGARPRATTTCRGRCTTLIARRPPRTPDAVAAQMAGGELTYRRAPRNGAGRLAARLAGEGARPGSWSACARSAPSTWWSRCSAS